ncbi:MAG TPA: GNAT family N-acetyltransferase [Frankiaceae bacterium]|nr:GNAT family N-acetyltransferase [Frankiaceae bacterium]
MTENVAIRVIRPDDAARLERLFYRLSPESVYRRFFTLYTTPPPGVMCRLIEVDHDTRDAAVAVVGDEIVGVGRYAADSREPGAAEVAVVVDDAWQGHGLGARLLAVAAALARLHGYTTLTAVVLADNAPAIRMLRKAFPDAEWRLGSGEYELRVPLLARERIPA